MTGLRVQFELVKSMSVTESLQIVAGQLFGSKDKKSRKPPTKVGASLDELEDFVKGLM